MPKSYRKAFYRRDPVGQQAKPEATLVVQDAILIHKHSGAASPIGVVHGEQPKASLIIHNGALLNGFTGR